jgi:hypothetical protein
LLRLGQIAGDWCRADDLLERVLLPFAIEHAPRARGVADASWLLERHVLWRLGELGLMEHRRPGGRRKTEYRLAPLFVRFLRCEL